MAPTMEEVEKQTAQRTEEHLRWRSISAGVEDKDAEKSLALTKACGGSKKNGKRCGKKAKGKGKATRRAKGKKKARTDVAEGGEGEEQAPKTKKIGLKAQVSQDVGARGVELVLAEARAKLATCEAAMQATRSSEKQLELEADSAKKAVEHCSSSVDAVVKRETVAMDKLKASCAGRLEAHRTTLEATAARTEIDQRIFLLEAESQSRLKVGDLADAQKAAQQATQAAKTALKDSKRAEKEAIEALKKTSAASQAVYLEKLKDSADGNAMVRFDAMDAKKAEKMAAKEMSAELSQLDMSRFARDMSRVKKVSEAAGLGRCRRAVASPKRLMGASPLDGSPGKAARVENDDVD